MEEDKDTKAGFTCPFCSAPYRNVVPYDTAQVKCEYCGATFSVLSHFKDTAERCPNHPKSFATGLCNDCGKSFCTRCLYVFDLKTRDAEARLHLCSMCLQQRHSKEADSLILIGVAFIFVGVFALAVSPAVGILVIAALSIPTFAYGFYKKSAPSKEPSIYDEKESQSIRKAKISGLTEDVDTDTLYGKMLSKDMMRWGAINAKERLDNEIYAYVRHGLDYEEAVLRVARARGIITAESIARGEAEAETEKEVESKETRKSKMVR